MLLTIYGLKYYEMQSHQTNYRKIQIFLREQAYRILCFIALHKISLASTTDRLLPSLLSNISN